MPDVTMRCLSSVCSASPDSSASDDVLLESASPHAAPAVDSAGEAGTERPTDRDEAAYDAALSAFTDVGAVARLGDALAARPDAAAHLDVVWTTHDTAIGPLLFAFHGPTLVRVAFASENFDAVVDDLARRLGPRTLRSARPADGLRREMDAYLDGRLRTFSVPHALVLSTAPFRRQVQEALPSIGYGHTASYSDMAAATGRPKAVRAVGSACATNPLPIVVPCHRVLRSDGGIGQYLGGTDLKRHLLHLEAEHASNG